MCSIPFVQAESFSTRSQSTDLLGPEIRTDMSAFGSQFVLQESLFAGSTLSDLRIQDCNSRRFTLTEPLN